MFAPDQLQTLIAKTLPNDPPPGSHGALIGTVNTEGVQVLVTVTHGGNGKSWELQAAVEHTWAGEDSAEARVLMRW